MTIKLSVALVTRNRPDSLKNTLESISNQNVQPYEIIISDDSNDEQMILLNKELSERYNCKYISGPQNGLYANRNYVAKHCTGTHIRTMDDDHLFPENHFIECVKAIESEPETIWTIGEYSNEVYSNKPILIPPGIPGQLHPGGYSYLPKNMNDYYGISCGGTIYPRSVIDKNILNCELYKFGIMYLEYGARLKKNGYKIKYLPSTYLIHIDIATTATTIPNVILNEARLFSMMGLSFYIMPTLKNKFFTVAKITYDILLGKLSLLSFRKAKLMTINFYRFK